MKFAVTGASGYIGEHFARRALASGHQFVALSRRAPKSVDSAWIPYELSSSLAPTIQTDIDVVLHLAVSTSRPAQLDSAQEVLAAELLIKAAQEIGANFIFVSSQTARPDAPTAYGRTKWQIEQKILDAGGCVVRPGQVYGGMRRGSFGELLRLIQRLPVLPAFLPAPRVQPIHVEDLVSGFLRIAEHGEFVRGVLCLASPEPVTFTAFLRAIARGRLRLSRNFLPVPSFVATEGLRLIGKRTDLERLRSLFDLPVMDTESDLRRLGLMLRSLDSGMHSSGDDARRRLFIEGRTFLSYLMRLRPRNVEVRSYVRAMENLRGGQALALPKPFVWRPILLALLDGGDPNATPWKREFAWRLDAATVLAEATSFGARRFLGLGEPHNFVDALLRIAGAVLAEAAWRILSVAFSPALRVFVPRTWREQR